MSTEAPSQRPVTGAPDVTVAVEGKEATPPSAKSKFVGAKAGAAKPKKKRKWLRRVGLTFLIGTPVSILALWIAIHKVEWLGPWLADAGRSILGNDAIAKLEDWAYGMQDRYNRLTRGDELPEAHWKVPQEMPTSLKEENVSKLKYPRFLLKSVGPMHSSFAAPGDGEWVPMEDARNPDEPPPMWKTLVHPDQRRGWAHVAVVAADLRQVRLNLIAGTMEPATELRDAKDYKRPGVIPSADVPVALAAFNGGFKATHGQYGMLAEGVLFIEPRNKACTVARFDKDVLRIASWENVESTRDAMTWFRQAPMCMYEDGVMHPGLAAETNTLWGATLDRDTVIRRSAIGISQDGQTLFVGISESTTAIAIATAMHHAGAFHVAQLDVNWSYPKFVTVEPGADAANPTVKPIIDGFEVKSDDYVRRPHLRDFFYLTRKATTEIPREALQAPPAPTPSTPTPGPG